MAESDLAKVSHRSPAQQPSAQTEEAGEEGQMHGRRLVVEPLSAVQIELRVDIFL